MGRKTSWVLMDIEGTTTSLKFVHETLFPFARQHLRTWLHAHREDAHLLRDLEALRDEAAADKAQGRTVRCAPPEHLQGTEQLEAIALRLEELMDADRKSTPLKSIQGRIWAEGYRDGLLHGHLYPDVLPAWQRWRDAGLRLAIYSSGSIAAQKLLFGHTPQGDLLPLLEAHFDTTSGGKKEAASYARIAKALAVAPEGVVFLTDNLQEADAARAAGMQTAVALRPDNPALPPHTHPTFVDFDDVHIDA